MKLQTVRVREFKSVWDSNTFGVDKITCLVGKNEAGKTALLQALYRLNPIVHGDGEFNATDDYPRSAVEDYEQDIENGRRDQAIVVEATFELESPELKSLSDEYGSGILKRNQVVVSKGYARQENRCTLFVDLDVDESALLKHLVAHFNLLSAHLSLIISEFGYGSDRCEMYPWRRLVLLGLLIAMGGTASTGSLVYFSIPALASESMTLPS
jgi:hypothetical protein